MSSRIFPLTVLACVWCIPGAGYVRLKTSNGTGLYRPDFANVQVLLNEKAVAGIGNASNVLWITADSDVKGALQSAMSSWNNVQTSAARFSSLQISSATSSTQGSNVVVFLDTPAIRSVLGPSALAQTSLTYAVGGASDGAIAWSFMYMNPLFTFSSTGAPNTVDLQSVFTHELGHALGANHTGSIGATMFQNLKPNSTAGQVVTPDDAAFVSNVYASPSAAGSYGSITGKLSIAGSPLRNALVDAIDTATGTVFSALTNGSDGTYSISVTPGSYHLIAQPIIGNINYNFYLCTPDIFPACSVLDNVDVNFQTGLAGSANGLSLLQVTAGTTTNGDFSPPAGSSAINVQYINLAPAAGGFPDWKTIYSVSSSLQITSGATVDLIMAGSGLDTTLTDANVSFMGPITLQPGTIRWDASLSNGLKVMRMTVNVGAVAASTTATMVLSQNGSTASFPGGLVLMPASAP